MATLHTYYCPKCGKGLGNGTPGTFIFQKTNGPVCDDCQIKGRMSGHWFMMVGAVAWLFLSLILCPEGPMLGWVVGGVFWALGMMRYFHQFQQKRQHKLNEKLET